VDQTHDTRRGVDDGRAGIARHAVDRREERVREVGKRRAASNLVEPGALEPRPVGMAGEVEHRAGDLRTAHQVERRHAGRLLEEEDGLVARRVRRDDPCGADVARREPDAERRARDAVLRSEYELGALADDTGASGALDRDRRRADRELRLREDAAMMRSE